ncbi:alpha-xylosidase [Insulibacter thermoxylanivorax]|uniref:alpha-D-xyloside xylohydrolase n=1 Tax=Insulibacter thermoxylanivorax TaxID=2749268 RepID=A0A916VEE6_9BACL|nr:alpha-xylosidase [Insulibacter thermoxylanivorax]GFR37132.1 alpha-xylosidase [Insulibacter thermoxylanivorax]
MKFTDGFWLVREGVTIQNPVEVRDVQVTDDAMYVYAATKHVRHRGDTLNATLITIKYSSPRPNIIRCEYIHHAGRVKRGPEFELYEAPTEVIIRNDEHEASLTSGKLQVRVAKGDEWKVDYIYDGRRLTGNGWRGAATIEVEGEGDYMREQLDLGIGEYVYGMGERFTPFVKNGQVVDIWNEDGGTSSEQAYKNVPFYISNYGYGIFVNHPERVSFEVASENVSKVQFSVPGERLEYFVIGGEDMKDVLNNYTALTGKPALPPAWSFGLWLTTSFTTSYDEETVNSFIDGMFERDIPLHVFHYDCFWMKEYEWCNFQWDEDVFPDPEGMLKRLKDKGLKISVWINPYIAQKSPLFKEGMEKGYLVKTPEGDVWQWDMWQAGMGLVDFTNPEATKWYQDKLRALVDMGVDTFKTDFGERIPTDVVYYDGSDPVKMHNYYTYLYNKAVFEVLEEKLGKNEAMLFARSATAGGQQFPVHWGGDNSANYLSMAETLRGGLSLGLSGFGFWSHDISGFENTAPPDIYKRWVAFGMLSSHSRLHGSSSYRVPWLFGEEAVDVLRHFTKLKSRLMPYLFSKAVEATQYGVPMMRPMVLEFGAEDPTTHPLDLQYMLGDKLLVAPIFNEEGTVRYYLPKGRWTNLITGAEVEGGWHYEKHDYFSLPLMVRPNSILAIGANDRRPDYDYVEGAELHVFALEEGKAATADIYNIKAELELQASALLEGSKITLNVDGSGVDKNYSFVLRGIAEAANVEGGTAEKTEQGLRIIPAKGAQQIVVTLS